MQIMHITSYLEAHVDTSVRLLWFIQFDLTKVNGAQKSALVRAVVKTEREIIWKDHVELITQNTKTLTNKQKETWTQQTALQI